MTRKEFDAFCATLKASTHVVQWGGASVWKIGGKIFAVSSIWGESEQEKISFKCSDLAFDILKEQPGLTPAPYLARAKWIQVTESGAMSDEDIKSYIETAYWIVARKLTKAVRSELGLTIPDRTK